MIKKMFVILSLSRLTYGTLTSTDMTTFHRGAVRFLLELSLWQYPLNSAILENNLYGTSHDELICLSISKKHTIKEVPYHAVLLVERGVGSEQ